MLHKIKLSRAQLDGIPEHERRLFILVSHASNELNVLSKLFHFTASASSDVDVVMKAENIQAVVLGRLLTGKIYECWILLQSSFFGTALSKKYEPQFDEIASQSLQTLKRYFSHENIIADVRNHHAFHYSPEQVEAGYQSLIDEDPLDIYLSESNANTLYEFADNIIGRAMLEGILPGDHERAFGKLIDDTASAVQNLNIVIGAIMTVCLHTYIGNDLDEMGAKIVQIEGVPESQGVYIPYFVEIDNTPVAE